MKGHKIIITLIVFFFLSSLAYAELPQRSPSCPSGYKCALGMKMHQGLVTLDACTAAALAFAVEWGATVPTEIQSCLTMTDVSTPCYTIYAYKCCNDPCPSLSGGSQDVILSENTITEIPVGEEKQAVENAFTQFQTEVSHPAKDGHTITDRYDGYVYAGQLGESEEDMSVNAIFFSRAQYTPNGSAAVPLSEIGVGSGTGAGSSEENPLYVTGGGASKDEMKEALNETFGEYEGTEEDLKSYETAPPTSIDSDKPEGIDLWPNASEIEKRSITDVVLGFMDDHPVLNIVKDSTIEITAGACEFETVVFGRTLKFGLCRFESFLQFFGSIILAIATLQSLFIVLGRRS